MGKLDTILAKENCCDKMFTLFDEEIYFTQEQISVANLKKYFDELKVKYVNQFYSQHDRLGYLSIEQYNFQRHIEITSNIFENICKDVNELWISGHMFPEIMGQQAYSLKQKYYNNPIYLVIHQPWYNKGDLFSFVSRIYHTTVIGTIDSFMEKIKDNELMLKDNLDWQSSHSKGTRDRNWVGGGFGIKGAIKGAIAAGFLNMAEDGLASIKLNSSYNSINSELVKEIKEFKSSINDLYRLYSEDKFVSDISDFIDALFMATAYSLKDIGFSYFSHYEAMLELSSYSVELQQQKLFEAVKSYPYDTEMYKYLSNKFPDEKNNIMLLRAFFDKSGAKTQKRNLSKERKKNTEIEDLLRKGLAFEDGQKFETATQYYLEAYKLNPQYPKTIASLDRLKIPHGNSTEVNNTIEKCTNPYDKFFTDYDVMKKSCERQYLSEGLSNALKLNDAISGIGGVSKGSKGKELVRKIIGDIADELIFKREVLFNPNYQISSSHSTLFEKFIFVNGRTVVYERQCMIDEKGSRYYGHSFNDKVCVKTKIKIQGNIDKILYNDTYNTDDKNDKNTDNSKIYSLMYTCKKCNKNLYFRSNETYSTVCKTCGSDLEFCYSQPYNPEKNIKQANQMNSHRHTTSQKQVTNDFSEYYKKAFENIENGKYSGFNFMAFLFGPLWALFNGAWLSAIAFAILLSLAKGIAIPIIMLIYGFNANKIMYNVKVKKKQVLW